MTPDDGTAMVPSATRRRTLAPVLVGLAPQWLIVGTSTLSIVIGVSVLAVVLGLLELHLWSCARERRAPGGRLVGLAAIGALIAFALWHVRASSFFWFVYIGVSLVLGAVCWTTLVWMVNAWRSPGAFDETRLAGASSEISHSFSLIVPARHEESVLGTTLTRLLETEHPDFELLVVVGADDLGTKAVAERVAAAHPDRVRVVVDRSWPKNKPKALNAALPHCTGDITGVFDAEDDVHPELIRGVDRCFRRTGADVVQAGVQLTNLHSSWFAVRNALEYYFWCRSRLHFHARAGFIPLGGNTVFIRTDVLRAVGGWDEECLAEDCELGVRLSSFGAKTVVFYEPELVTREETPPTLGAFVRQRTRWNQGYLQTLSRGYWRGLPLKQRTLGLYTLAMPYLLALAWVMIPAAIATAIAVTAPVPITLLLFFPALPILVVLAVEATGLGDMCRSCGERALVRDYARLVLGLPIYQGALAFASARAVVREARGTRGWEKTAHFGLHRAEPDQEIVLTEHEEIVLAGAGAHALVGAPVTIDAHLAVAHSDAPQEPQLVDHAAYRSNGIGAGNGNGNGHHHSERWPALVDLAERTGAEPLWIRLGSKPLNGSAAPDPVDGHPRDTDTPPEDVATNMRTRLARLRSSRASEVAVQLPLLVGVGLVQVVNLSHWPGSFFDEGTYVSNAWAVENHGALSNYTYGYGHPPLGWLLVSLWTWTIGLFHHTVYSVAAGRQLIVVLSIVSCWLLYVLVRRLGIGRPFAVVAVCLFALSPVSLYFHRLVLIDNPAVAFTLAAFVLALSPRRRLWTFAASGACFAAGVLSKESMLILLPVLVLLALQNADRRTRRYCLTFLAAFLVLIGLAYPLYAALKGELFPGPGHVSLIGEAFVQFVRRKATGSVFDPQSQTYGIVHVWLHFDPWLLGAAVALSPLALALRTTRAAALGFVLQAVVVLRPGYLPYMYVIGMLPFAAIVVAGTTEALWRVARRGLRHPDARRRWRALVTRVSVAMAPVTRAVAAAVLLFLVTGFAVVVGPRWARADRDSMTVRLDGPERAAQQWLVRNVDHRKRLLVSDDFWIYLVEHGFDAHPVKGGFFSRTVVFYWSLDYDPAVRPLVPQGWRNFDYVVSTQGMRNDKSQVPQTAQALDHSRSVVSFGVGTQRIDIRAVEGHVSAPLDVPAGTSKKRK